MKKTITSTLRDLIHAINIIGDDTDIYTDGIDSIAVCPPVMLTPEGEKHFAAELNATVITEYSIQDTHQGTYINCPEDEADEAAYNFLAALGGYCKGSDHKTWFTGQNAKII